MGINCSTPIFHDGQIFAASAYGAGGGMAKLVANGDGGFRAEEVWFSGDMENHHGGMDVSDGCFYGANGGNGGGYFVCLDFNTGEVLWNEADRDKRRARKGSIACADGRIYYRTEVRGSAALFRGLCATSPAGPPRKRREASHSKLCPSLPQSPKLACHPGADTICCESMVREQGAGFPAGPAGFQTTQWTAVLAAGNDASPAADEALESLCRAYWYPIYASVRRRGHDWHTAQDLTQAFFQQLLEHRSLRSVQREKGKFRSFLLACLRHFLANARREQQTLKRGGAAAFVPLDFETAECLFLQHRPETVSAELSFDRDWAVRVLEEAMDRLESEAIAAGKEQHFATLKPYLVDEVPAGAYEAIAPPLDMKPHAVAMAVNRLRARLRAVVRETVAQTVATPLELEEELRYLREILSS